MKAASFLLLVLLFVLPGLHSQEKPLAESKTAPERAFDAVVSVNEHEKTNKKFVDQLQKMIDNLRESEEDHTGKIEALEEMLQHFKSHMKDDPATVLHDAADEAKKIAGDEKDYIDQVKSALAKTVFDLIIISAKGTGQTTGHIATISVKNKGEEPIDLASQTFFIPSDGKYQSYVGRIPVATFIFPEEISSVPVNGYCTDVSRPPVPMGEGLPPIEEWVSVGGTSVPAMVLLLPGVNVPAYSAEDIPSITSSPIFKEGDPPMDGDIVATWPGTDQVIEGTIDMNGEAVDLAPLVVKIVQNIEKATNVIIENEDYTTPISGDPEREFDAIAQQTIWYVLGIVTGDYYTKDEFEENIHEQIESSSGTSVTNMPEEEQEKVQKGVDDFWSTFTATGIEAKVIKEDNLLTVTPKCDCEEITFRLVIERNGIEVHDQEHTANGVTARINNFDYGDEFDVKITDINVDCDCNGTTCEFYPAQSTNPGSPRYTKPDTDKPGKVNIFIKNDGSGVASENNNCQYSDEEWNADEDEFSFTLETKDERNNESAVFQKFTIKAYCQLDDCRKGLCKRTVQLNLVDDQ